MVSNYFVQNRLLWFDLKFLKCLEIVFKTIEKVSIYCTVHLYGVKILENAVKNLFYDRFSSNAVRYGVKFI